MKYGLIGKRLPHTFSPEIHMRFGYEYEVKELPDENAVAEFLQAKDFVGINVTIPYKEVVMPYLDVISEEAKIAGSVNTVVNKSGKLFGYNTDIAGMKLGMALAGISVASKHVIILGSGGTAKTATCVCKDLQAEDVKIISRNGIYNYQNCYDLNQTQVIINATPVGMSPSIHGLPLDIARFEKLESVFDAVYNPLRTRLVLAARDRGLKSSGGLIMLTAQAKLSRDIFLGERSGLEAAAAVANDVYKSRVNIVLIGMPGAGKSTIGRRLSAMMNRSFYDSDSEIATLTGSTPSEIITQSGEPEFRRIEAEVLTNICGGFYSVIATGGGALTFGINSDTLRENGFVVYVKRDIEKLALEGRPLSKNLHALYESRKNLYESVADCVVDNNGDIEDTLKEIIRKYDEYTGY